jgi:hypothetical protein
MAEIKKNKENEATVKSDRKLIIICLLLASVIFIIDTIIPLGVAAGVLYIIIVLISLWSKNSKITFYMAAIGSILTILGFYSSSSGGELWKVLTNRSLSLFAIWAVTVLSLQRKKLYDQKEKALSEVKILTGLLPICAACKKIRNDAGYWERIEGYIMAHSQATFTHGICPECNEELYGDFLSKRKKRQD